MSISKYMAMLEYIYVSTSCVSVCLRKSDEDGAQHGDYRDTCRLSTGWCSKARQSSWCPMAETLKSGSWSGWHVYTRVSKVVVRVKSELESHARGKLHSRSKGSRAFTGSLSRSSFHSFHSSQTLLSPSTLFACNFGYGDDDVEKEVGI